MAKTSNEQFRDALLHRHVKVMRYSKTLARQVIALLDATEGPLRDAIEHGLASGVINFDAHTHERLNALAEVIKEIRGGAFDEANTLLQSELKRLAISEVHHTDQALHKVLPVKVKTVIPDRAKLTDIVGLHPIQGHVLDKHAENLQRADADRIMATIISGLAQDEGVDSIIRAVRGGADVNGSNGILEATRRSVAKTIHTVVMTVVNEARQQYFRAN